MRALSQTTLDGPAGLRLVEIPVPQPRAGEVLIRVAAAGVNFVDLARGRGAFGVPVAPPFVAGFEAAGEIVALGDGVPQAALGTLVVAAGPGAFAEHVIAPAAAVMPVPAGWSALQAMGLVVNWPTALAALALGRLAAGETILIHAAAGATGAAILTLAKHRGARVLAVASASKHASVHADHVLDAADPDLAETVRALTGRHGADLVIESAGGATFEASLAATRRITGRVVVIGLSGGEATIRNWDLVYRHPIQILGFNLGALIQSAPQLFGSMMQEMDALIAAGIIAPARPTTRPLAEGAHVLAALERRQTTGKLALVPPSS